MFLKILSIILTLISRLIRIVNLIQLKQVKTFRARIIVWKLRESWYTWRDRNRRRERKLWKEWPAVRDRNRRREIGEFLNENEEWRRENEERRRVSDREFARSFAYISNKIVSNFWTRSWENKDFAYISSLIRVLIFTNLPLLILFKPHL